MNDWVWEWWRIKRYVACKFGRHMWDWRCEGVKTFNGDKYDVVVVNLPCHYCGERHPEGFHYELHATEKRK